ncbi:MAG: SprT family zinc-dependent metalloprotease [Clostridium sp.]
MNYIIVIDDKEIEYEINFSKRKSVSIRILEPYKIEVKAPSRVDVKRIVEFVESKKNWISKKSKEMKLVNYKVYEKKYTDGEIYLVFGKEYKLQIIVKNELGANNTTLHNNILCISTNDDSVENIKNMLENLYRKLTYNEIIKSVNKLQTSFAQVPTQIKVKEQKRRWGSCTGKDALLFNWRLSMCPKEVIEYVVLHEMCHMVHKNHSKNYWDLVLKLMPNYKEKELWLKENAYKIV